MIEVKVQLQGEPRLSICADAEGLSGFYSSVQYVTRRLDDVMYTSEEWHGELAAESLTDNAGILCARFDLFPEAQAAEDFSRVVCSAEEEGGFTASIVASAAWYLHFAQEIQRFIEGEGQEGGLEIASKMVCRMYRGAEADGDILIHVQKI